MKPKKCSPVDPLNPDFLFWHMNNSSSTLIGYRTLAIEFFWLKNHTSYYYINSFSLLWISFFPHTLSLSLCLFLSVASHRTSKYEKKKKNKSIWPSLMVGRRTSSGGVVNVVVLHGERRSPPALSFWRSDPAFFLSSLSLFLSSLMWSKWGCWNVLEEKKKIKEGG